MTKTVPLFDCVPITPPKPFWVFAYGSLMWNPDFEFLRRETARLQGFHRALCIYSIHYRGTPDQPGLVLGLDNGGECQGRAYLVSEDRTEAVLDYLTKREMRHGSYDQTIATVTLAGGETVKALTYVANRDHWQYVAEHDPLDMAKRVMQGIGAAGHNIDYLKNTIAHLKELGIEEDRLETVLAHAIAAQEKDRP